MDPAILALLAGLVVLLLVILVRLFTGGPATQQLLDLKRELAELKTGQLEGQNRAMAALADHLERSQGALASQLTATGEVVSQVNQRLGSLAEAARRMQEIGGEIASLQEILRAPKLRGNLGEYLLEDLLRQVLPGGNWAVQHRFRNGTVVDAVIRLGGSLVPVDAKFPLESFQRFTAAAAPADRARARRELARSVKARIDEIAQRYINPDEGTFDFALMYVPAESVFYEIITADAGAESPWELFQYATSRRVIPVSPNSFYSYLMAIAFGLRGMRIGEQARVIVGELARVEESFGAWVEEFALLGRHLRNAGQKFDECQRRVDRFGDTISRITGAMLPEPVERPSRRESTP